eukprot:TRINITY_DN13588_c0_g1_i1.p1 TRINITY_DN13588_c0_g1~~TRINITY_DN13588_c0_g1_i1.p1  ORF type:complete len:351 (-),score=75.15 TRINITY_DN13588_c0_g1_i1:60-1058(-)
MAEQSTALTFFRRIVAMWTAPYDTDSAHRKLSFFPALNAQENTVQVDAPKSKPADLHFVRRVVLGGIAGIVGASSVFPMDVVKTLLMSQKPGPDGKLPYNGIADAFTKLRIERGGFMGIYNGLIAQLVGITPEKAIKLAANDFFRFNLPKNAKGELPLVMEMVAGAGAGLCQFVATNPMEIVKIQMQVSKAPASVVLKQLGLAGLYKGSVSTLIRDIPFSAVFFPLHARGKKFFDPINSSPSLDKVFLSGSFAGFVAATITTPFDVVKTRVQAPNSPYKGVVDAFTRTVKEDGSRALWRGVVPRMLIISPLFGITLLVYESLQQWASRLLDH